MPETERLLNHNSEIRIMNKLKTTLACYDDFRWFSEDVRSRFDDTSKYNISSFVSVEDFMASLEKGKDHKNCKIAILGAHDTTEQFTMISRLTAEIKKLDPKIRIILICTPDKMEEIRKIIPENVDVYIPKNANAIIRLHTAVKKLISEYEIINYRKRRNLSLFVLAGSFLLFIILFIIARMKFPL